MANSDSPHVIAPPPVVFAAGFAVALILQWLWPMDLFEGLPAVKLIGLVVAFAAGLLALWGFVTMMRGGTNLDPYKPTLAIVSNGPFAFSRNPMYVSLALLSIGAALFFGVDWALVMLVPTIAVVHFFIILREERYLEGKFGQAYLDYKAKVRRWV